MEEWQTGDTLEAALQSWFGELPVNRGILEMELKVLASQSIPTSNQIISWLKELESLRKVLPEVSGLPLAVGN